MKIIKFTKMKLITSLIILIATIMSTFNFQISQAQNAPQDYLDAHNKARKEVGVTPMIWNKTLASDSEKLAAQRIEACNLVEDLFKESIAEASYPITGMEAVELWISEKPYYDYDKNDCTDRNCDHYTQVVWNKTTSVGCSRAQCKSGYWFVSCMYYPEGNYPLQRPYNKTLGSNI